MGRYGIRQLSAQQLRHCDDAGRAANNGEAGLAGSQEKLRETIQALLEAPVAVCTSEPTSSTTKSTRGSTGCVWGLIGSIRPACTRVRNQNGPAIDCKKTRLGCYRKRKRIH